MLSLERNKYLQYCLGLSLTVSRCDTQGLNSSCYAICDGHMTWAQRWSGVVVMGEGGS